MAIDCTAHILPLLVLPPLHGSRALNSSLKQIETPVGPRTRGSLIGPNSLRRQCSCPSPHRISRYWLCLRKLQFH